MVSILSEEVQSKTSATEGGLGPFPALMLSLKFPHLHVPKSNAYLILISQKKQYSLNVLKS